MRYLFSSGLFAAITSGISLLRGTRTAPITWRAVLAWLSWGITFAFAVGSAVDMRRDKRGLEVSADSPLAPAQAKRARKAEKAMLKALKH